MFPVHTGINYIRIFIRIDRFNVPCTHRDKPLVRIESNSTEYNGDYKIISIEHNGDLYGFNWHSKLVCICGKFDKV